MSEKILRAVLSVIPTILLVVCVVAAFATQGWDVQRTIFAEDPLKTVERLMPFELGEGAGEEFLEVTGFEISDGWHKLVIEVVLHSPLNVPVKIKELSAEGILDSSTVTVSLPGQVEVPAKGSASLKLEGSLPRTQAQTQIPPFLPSEKKLTLRSMNMTLEIRGIGLEVVM